MFGDGAVVGLGWVKGIGGGKDGGVICILPFGWSRIDKIILGVSKSWGSCTIFPHNTVLRTCTFSNCM